jgi:hypothetical protein
MGALLSSKGLTYLTDAWDRRLYEAPGNDSPYKSYPDLEAQQDVRVVGVHSRGGAPAWYLVVLVRGSCTGDPLEVIDYGWVPEYQETGGNTLWYYSRGC